MILPLHKYVLRQLSFGLLDRFKEAQQVLIPAWQYHVQQTNLNILMQN